MAYDAFMRGGAGHDLDRLYVVRAATIKMHEAALLQVPKSVWTHYRLGVLYWCAARLDEAAAQYETVLRLAPREGRGHTWLGKCLLGLGERGRAKVHLELACRAPSSTPGANILQAEAHLLLGHHLEGWRMHDLAARHLPGAVAGVITRHLRCPFWEGESLEGPLLIGACEGFGDVLMCARYVSLARRRVHSLTLLVDDALLPLLRGQFEDVEVRGFGAPPDPRQFKAWLHMMCLPHVFGIRSAEDIPPAPYLHASETFRHLPGDFKVGIRWAGDPWNAHDSMRSTHLTQWAPVLGVDGATFYSFQFQAAAVQLGEPVGAGVVDLAPELGNWGHTGAALSQMDLVIAVDSSLAHLAGALNRPVWIPLQAAVEWRWGIESPTTPWYPSARLFRQQRVHEWAPVFELMAAELREMIARRRVEAA
jgi:hypothetical protein